MRIILRAEDGWREYRHPVAVIAARSTGEVRGVLAQLEAAAAAGLTGVGFLTYEAAPGLDSALVTAMPGVLPPVYFGLFAGHSTFAWPPLDRSDGPAPGDAGAWTLATTPEDYRQRLHAIREALAQGRTYQVNHTERLHAAGVDPYRLFLDRAAAAAYGAYIETPEFVVVSASPELLFELRGEEIVCRPMKGTAVRSPIAAIDPQQALWLRGSEKNRAENVMITDMVRNDLGRIARPGSVQVRALFGVERLAHVWQMTSTVQARTMATLPAIFQALFPGASITGAPKAASMQLIEGLETSPREIYCGAIGLVEPGRRARFSIAIRTAWFDCRTGEGTFGAGGGIVWDSDPDDELAELQAKARVVNVPQRPSFDLLETLRFTMTAGFGYLGLHRQRLARSADYFDRPFAAAAFDALLKSAARHWQADMRVRVRLQPSGRMVVEATRLAAGDPDGLVLPLVALGEGIDPVFLAHKTSVRAHYEAAGSGREVLLFNRHGCITESSIANVVYTFGTGRLTPPLGDGLLGGVFRQHLLDTGQVRERSLHVDELQHVQCLWLVNALRGERRVERIVDGQGRVLFMSPGQSCTTRQNT